MKAESVVRNFTFDMQVYVSVYADGPTRVLRFADEKSTALLEAEQSILDLAARLKQVCSWLQHITVDCLTASIQHNLATRYQPYTTLAVSGQTDVVALTALALLLSAECVAVHSVCWRQYCCCLGVKSAHSVILVPLAGRE